MTYIQPELDLVQELLDSYIVEQNHIANMKKPTITHYQRYQMLEELITQYYQKQCNLINAQNMIPYLERCFALDPAERGVQ